MKYTEATMYFHLVKLSIPRIIFVFLFNVVRRSIITIKLNWIIRSEHIAPITYLIRSSHNCEKEPTHLIFKLFDQSSTQFLFHGELSFEIIKILAIINIFTDLPVKIKYMKHI